MEGQGPDKHSTSEPKHSRLPGIENPSSVRLSDSTLIRQSGGAFQSRIPRPISRSTDTALLLDESSRETITPLRSQTGQDNPGFEREVSALTTDRRPRYARYNSYVDMLGDMDQGDPFRGNTPPPRTEREVSIIDADRQKIKKKKRRRQLESRRDTEGPLHQNPVYEDERTSRERRVSSSTYTAQDWPSPSSRPNDHYTRPSSIEMNMQDEGHYHRQADPYNQKLQGSNTRVYPLDNNQFVRGVSDNPEVFQYVSNNIRHRQCKTYLRTQKKDGSKCQCGRDQSWHEDEGIPIDINDQTKWKPDCHSKQIRANTYGTIQFHGFGQEAPRPAPYIRVAHDTPPDKVLKLLREKWHLPAPKLIISVTGGAKRFFIKPRLLDSFKRGLVNAATSTGAWIITGGTNAGVMQYVGEAVRDHMLATGGSDSHNLVALGIATWGIIDNRKSLISDDCLGLFPAHYNIDHLSDKSVRGISPLDYNHTNFILVDDGSVGKFGVEIRLRTDLEEVISKSKISATGEQQSDEKIPGGAIRVPVVLLVLEGGENTIETAINAISKDTPVLVIQGSGRAADFISYAVNKYGTKDSKEQWPPGFKEDLTERSGYMLDWSRETDQEAKLQKIDKSVENVMKLVEIGDKLKLVTVFHMDDVDTTNEIDHAILYALLKAKRSDAQSQLKLALAWNRCDVARQEIFKMENRSQWQKMDLYSAFKTALIQDQVDFVQLFLDNGVDLKKFLTVRRLRDLYEEVVYRHATYCGPSADGLRHLIQEVQQTFKTYMTCSRTEKSLECMSDLLVYVGMVVRDLSADQHQNLYRGDKYVVTDEDDHEPVTGRTPRPQEVGLNSDAKSRCDFSNPERELFLWAVLLNRQDMAMIFWKNGRDHIGGALSASAILKSLSEHANNDEEIDLSIDLLNHAKEFEELAVGVLNECYQRNKPMAHDLLVRELNTWGGTTLMTIADSSQQMDFMGHSACQTKLNKIWKGKMALYTASWKILTGLILPFMLLTIRFFESDAESSNTSPTQESSENEMKSHDGEMPVSGHYAMTAASVKTVPRPKQVTLCGCGTQGNNTITFCRALYYFHVAPVVKFMYHTLAQILYLALFSYFVLTDLRPASEPNSPSIEEYIIWGWTATLFIEEMRQILTRDSKSFKFKVSNYFSSVWNQFDLFVYLVFLLSIILRYTLSEKDFIWARMMYCLSLSLFYIRFMHVFFVEKNIGPKVIMIRRMFTDLIFFFFILIVVIFAYGVASQALRFPNHPPSWIILKDIIYKPYWQMYGELFLEELEGDVGECTNDTSKWADPDVNKCPEESWLVIVLFAIYMIMTNILLLNLLIAMFSYTFERVQENSEQVWRFYRYGLIYEYFDRPTLAPPLIIISHIIRICKYIYRKCKKNEKIDTDFKLHFNSEKDNKLTVFERARMENYLLNRHIESREHIDAKVSTTGARIEHVIEELERLKEHMTSHSEKATATDQKGAPAPSDIPPTSRQEAKEDNLLLENRIRNLEGQLYHQSDQMDSMMEILKTLTQQGGLPRPSHTWAPQPRIEIQDLWQQ